MTKRSAMKRSRRKGLGQAERIIIIIIIMSRRGRIKSTEIILEPPRSKRARQTCDLGVNMVRADAARRAPYYLHQVQDCERSS
ncbi:uncharacterized protein STEHIDRAFT_118803, partial [Stereum hirsutum FP-91666 SS1]|uniref:uncharacterized protein n=1 Tax=Stereum hirsutum (strain FP-91666) TaxID=721885 RepID=UPI0004410472